MVRWVLPALNVRSGGANRHWSSDRRWNAWHKAEVIRNKHDMPKQAMPLKKHETKSAFSQILHVPVHRHFQPLVYAMRGRISQQVLRFADIRQ